MIVDEDRLVLISGNAVSAVLLSSEIFIDLAFFTAAPTTALILFAL